MTKYFVWVSGLRGPVAHIWHDIPTDGNGKRQISLTPPIRLLDNDIRSIEELKLEFTYENCMLLKNAE